MSIVTIPMVFEVEFVSGVWTDMTAAPGYVDSQSAISWRRGVSLGNRAPEVSTLNFNIDNSSEAFTPGNTSSAFYNQLREGIGVRFRSNYGATLRYHFAGVITAIRPAFPLAGSAGLRIPIECEGLSSLLNRYDTYSMALQQGKRTGEVMAAMMTAAGSSAYSFETTGAVIPYAYPRSDVLADISAVAQSEPFGGFWEDGQGRLRLKRMESMLGSYGSPTHTWGSTIAPNEGVQPDYRSGERFGKVTLQVARLSPGTAEVELWREPTNALTGAPPRMAAGELARLSGKFTRVPISVRTRFQQAVATLNDTGARLYSPMNSSQTTMTVTKSSHLATYPFGIDDLVRVDDEFMAVTGSNTADSSFIVLTVTRGANGSVAASHATPLPNGTPIYRQTPSITLTDVGFLMSTISGTGTTLSTVSNIFFNLNPQVNDIIRIDAERMKITAVNTSLNTISVIRQYPVGAGGVSHSNGARVYKETQSLSTATDFLGPSYIQSSANVSGYPADKADVIGEPVFTGGDHIRYDGRGFDAYVRNTAAALRYRSAVVIGGYALEIADDPAEIIYERAIPGIIGVPDGPTVSVPFGLTDSTAVFAGVNEVQTLTISAASGYFRLAFRGAQTGAITWSSTNATLRTNVETALLALPTISTGNVEVAIGTMTAGIGTLTITFIGALGLQPVDEITIQQNALGGGSVSVVQTTSGVSSSPAGEARVAKGYAMGLLRAGRVQTPWLTVKLLANQSDNVTSVLNADITDLVRYTGTGTWREKIDEFYRIMSIGCDIDEYDQWLFTFQLAPAHMNRNAKTCWWTDFSAATTGRGEFLIAPPATNPRFPSDTQWAVSAPPLSDPVNSPMRANAPGVAAPTPACVNVGSADMVVWTQWYRGVTAQNTFDATTGGYGMTFRASGATGSSRWEVRANPTQSLIYLWNTSAGVVGTPAPWTPTDSIELEVRAMGDRIRVYRDCLGEPIIDVTNTFGNTNTYADMKLDRDIVSGGGVNPYCTEFGAQGL